MNDRTETEITKITPSFLTKPQFQDDSSLAGMEEYRVLSRLKIIQSMTDKDLKKVYGEGSCIIQPGNALVFKDGDAPFKFVPHMFFVHWCKWGDRRDTEKMIYEESFSPTSDVAKCAKDKNLRFELYAGEDAKKDKPMTYRYVEHLRFPGILYDGDLEETPVVLSFERGEYITGRNFISAIKLRRVKDEEGEKHPIPLWAQVWDLKVGLRERGTNAWYGFDFTPSGEIDEADAEAFQASHLELKQLHEDNKLRVDEGDGQDEDGKGGVDSEKF